jgi:hypothetical protein
LKVVFNEAVAGWLAFVATRLLLQLLLLVVGGAGVLLLLLLLSTLSTDPEQN